MFLICRDELLRLRSENVELRGLLKEQKSTECKEKESTDASGNSSDGQAELKRSLETLQAESHGQPTVINLSKEKGEKTSVEVTDGETPVTTEMIVSTTEGMESPQTKGQSHSKSTKQHVTRQGVSFVLSVKKCFLRLIVSVFNVCSISFLCRMVPNLASQSL